VIRERFGSRLGSFDLSGATPLDPPLGTDLEKLRAGGVGGVFWSVWVPTGLGKDEAVRTVLEQIDLVHRMPRPTQTTSRSRSPRPTCAGSTPPAASRR